jgi:hypothetical protein
VLLCSLAACLASFACGSTRHGDPASATGEVGEAGAPSDGSRAGASASGAGGASAQAGREATGGSPVIVLTPTAGSPNLPEEPVVVPHAATPCENPQPFPQGGGYLVCEDKSLRLGERTACPSILPRDQPTEPLFYEECALDVDCTESAHGFCAYGQCKYGCVSDDECGAQGLCFCGAEIGQCVSTECRSDADCPADYPCTGNLPFGIDIASFRCQTPLDSCQSDYDCPGARVHCRVEPSDVDPARRCIRDTVG